MAIGIGLLGSVCFWIFAPYSSLLNTGHISDSYLPVAPLFLLLLILVGLNPLLYRFRPAWALNRMQLATVLGVFLIACVIPGQGLLRILPYSIARIPYSVSQNPRLAEAYRQAGIRQELFPDRIDGHKDVPAAEDFLGSLPEGGSIPWRAWLQPLWAWGVFLIPAWLMLVAMALIVVPQWRNNERLSFPILSLEQSLIETPAEGRLLASLFRARSFWIATAAVFALHILSGLNTYDPESVPAIPINWNLAHMFREGLLRFLPGHIHTARIYFIFLGMAFFMSNRIGFSVWFFTVAYAAYVVIGMSYFQPFNAGTITDHRVGAMFVLTGAILWLGRAHWTHVGRCMVGHAETAVERRDGRAGWVFVLGSLGMFVWMVWMANIQPWWALFYVGMVWMAGLLTTRLVAETGMPFIRLDMRYHISPVRMIGGHLVEAKSLWLLSGASLYFSTFMALLFMVGSRISPTVMASHSLQLDDQAGPGRQFRFALILVGVLIVGVVVSGAAHLHMNYHHSTSLDGRVQPVNSHYVRTVDRADRDLLRLHESGVIDNPEFNDPNRWDLGFGHVGFGLVLAAVLFALCLRSPAWPLHPIGLVMVNTFYSNLAWASIFLGWLAKVLILRYGGARLYRAARPVFLGLIIGEVLAAAYWGVEPVIRLWLGMDYVPVIIVPQ